MPLAKNLALADLKAGNLATPLVGLWEPTITSSGYTGVVSLQASLGRTFDLFNMFQGWGADGVSPNGWGVFNAPDDGAIAMLTWEPWNYSVTDATFKLSTLTGGSKDTYIDSWAIAIKALGSGTQPVFLRLGHEFNGNWVGWHEGNNGNVAGDFVAFWRHVWTRFHNLNVQNVIWVWCPNAQGDSAASLAEYYPGDAYVDWVALDGYNKGTDSGPGWLTFDQVFQGDYATLRQIAPTKPMMLAEVGSSEVGGNKAAWIRDMFGHLAGQYSAVKAIAWFSDIQGSDFRINSSPASLAAFRDGWAVLETPVVSLEAPVTGAFGNAAARLQAMVPVDVWGEPDSNSAMQVSAYCLGTEIQNAWDAVLWIIQQAYPQTADSNGLTYWEQLLGLPMNPPNLSTAQRREVVLSRRHVAGPVQIPSIKALIAQYQQGASDLTWDPIHATLTVKWSDPLGIPPNQPDVDWALQKFLPAWIKIAYGFTYLLYRDLAGQGNTYDYVRTHNATYAALSGSGQTYAQVLANPLTYARLVSDGLTYNQLKQTPVANL